MSPKGHCELAGAGIEYDWGRMKQVFRRRNKYTAAHMPRPYRSYAAAVDAAAASAAASSAAAAVAAAAVAAAAAASPSRVNNRTGVRCRDSSSSKRALERVAAWKLAPRGVEPHAQAGAMPRSTHCLKARASSSVIASTSGQVLPYARLLENTSCAFLRSLYLSASLNSPRRPPAA